MTDTSSSTGEQTIAAETDAAFGENKRPDSLERAGAAGEGMPVAASDPRSLTIDRGAEDSASPGANQDEAVAREADPDA